MLLNQIIPTDSIPDIGANAREELSLLKSLSFDDLVNKLANDIVQFAIHLAIAILVFYAGKFVIKKLYRIVDSIMARRDVDRSLSTFVLSLIRIVLYFILLVTVISILGIETSSFIAIFASAGVAIGMALSGTLQNFAGGVLILLLKPYRIGDYIEAQGYAGTVTEIQIFNTIICTPDNKSIIIPNGGLSTGTINNWSREDYRRIEWQVGISYGDDVDAARKAIRAMFAADPDIVKTTTGDHRRSLALSAAGTGAETSGEQPADSLSGETPERKNGWIYRLFHHSRRHARRQLRNLDAPVKTRRMELDDAKTREPMVAVAELADSSVVLTVRAWVPSSRYWDVFYRYNERFYSELPSRSGISFPFPQMDVHFPNGVK